MALQQYLATSGDELWRLFILHRREAGDCSDNFAKARAQSGPGAERLTRATGLLQHNVKPVVIIWEVVLETANSTRVAIRQETMSIRTKKSSNLDKFSDYDYCQFTHSLS
jgi:hypothetical protein